MDSRMIQMAALSGNQKSMRTHVRRYSSFTPEMKFNRKKSVNKPKGRKNKSRARVRNRSRTSLSNVRSEIRNGSLDLAPKVRKNKVIRERESEMFNFDDMDQDYFELEKITSFLRTSLKSKNLKEFIKANQEVFDNFIDRVDSGKWMGIDLRSMHGFFIKCFKNKVLLSSCWFSSKSRPTSSPS